MPDSAFRIGDVFPAEAPLARYVVVLGAIFEDFRLTMGSMAAAPDGDEGMGTRLLRFRQAVAYSHEATAFLKAAQKHHTEIDDFVKSLDARVLESYERIFVELRPVRRWMREQRNAAFHYPDPIPRRGNPAEFDDKFATALAAAADDVSGATLTETYRGVRFGFAYAVLVHRLGFKLPEQAAEFGALVQALQRAESALRVFVVAAVSAYLGTRPAGAITEV